MAIFLVDNEDLRYILQNAGKIKRDDRCLHCDGTGYQNWNEDGEDIKTGWSDDIERCTGECEECGGVGFMLDLARNI